MGVMGNPDGVRRWYVGETLPDAWNLEFFGFKLTICNENTIDTTDYETAERRRMIERLDYEATEAVEQQLDQFIEKRTREREDANRIEEAWAESERRHQEHRRERNRELWRTWHLGQAERLERTAAELAADHRARAEALRGRGVLS
jgi:hypothetical protein